LYSNVDDLYLWDQALYTEQSYFDKKNNGSCYLIPIFPRGPGQYGYNNNNGGFNGEK
jgi:hypothetical protein